MTFRTISAVAVIAFAAGCSGPGSTPAQQTSEAVQTPASAVGSPGSHVGGHGMVLFGSEKLYLSHIPTYGNPHNIQVIVEATIASGVPTEAQHFGDKGYSLRPGSAWSLYDLAAGTLGSIKGTIFEGNFESGGRPKFANVVFNITKVIFSQGLLPSLPKSPTLDYVAVGTKADAYLVHVLDEQRGFDQVVGVTATQGSLDEKALSAGQLLSISGGVNGVRTRLNVGATVTVDAPAPATTHENEYARANVDAGAVDDAATSQDDGGSTKAEPVSLKVRGEFSCLLGPDFFQHCPALPPVTP